MAFSEAKQTEVAAIRARFEKASAAVLLDFRGVEVGSITALRAQFREAGVDYKVVKNTLTRLALAGTDADHDELKAHLKGPTAIAWSYEDPSAAAKIVKKFRKDAGDEPTVEVKCGILDNQVMDGATVEKVLATMPGKDEVRAHLLATLQAPAQNLVALLQAPGQNLVYLLDAKKRQAEEA
jgi:large subunit ribosomal protein L10